MPTLEQYSCMILTSERFALQTIPPPLWCQVLIYIFQSNLQVWNPLKNIKTNRNCMLFVVCWIPKPSSILQYLFKSHLKASIKICHFYCIRLGFIIHPCDPTVVICYLIWACDIAVNITHIVSYSSSLSYHRLGI